jgi:hypothetical protein
MPVTVAREEIKNTKETRKKYVVSLPNFRCKLYYLWKKMKKCSKLHDYATLADVTKKKY